MTDKNNNLHTALASVEEGREYIVQELRAMAAAEREYKRFTYMSKWVKNIWNAAADIIEGSDKEKEDVRYDA